MNDAIKVIIPIIIAGSNIEDSVAVKDIPTASASMLVAIQRNKRDRNQKIFVTLSDSFDSFDHSYIIFPPIYASNIKAIQ